MLKQGLRHATKAGWALALVLFARTGTAQNAQPAPAAPTATTPERPPGQPAVTYVDGQLKISGLNVTLAEVLAKVSVLTGVKIDIPDGAASERMAIVESGPGPARQVLAELMSDSNFDYLLLASDTDQNKLQSVLVMPREKKETIVAANRPEPPRSRFPRAIAPAPEEAPAPTPHDNPAPAAAAEPATAPNQQPPAAPPDPSQPPAPADPSTPPPTPDQSAPPAPDPSLPVQTQQPGMLNGLRIAPQPVPNMDAQSINQQLQQMYQQRVQLQPGAQQQTVRQ